MRVVEVVNRTRDRTLGAEVKVADRWWLRLRGLLGRKDLAPGEGLILTPCTSVHTLGMRFPIDVAFVDEHGVVIALYPHLAPGRATRFHRGAVCAVELRRGALESTGTMVGDTIAWGTTLP